MTLSIVSEKEKVRRLRSDIIKLGIAGASLIVEIPSLCILIGILHYNYPNPPSMLVVGALISNILCIAWIILWWCEILHRNNLSDLYESEIAHQKTMRILETTPDCGSQWR